MAPALPMEFLFRHLVCISLVQPANPSPKSIVVIPIILNRALARLVCFIRPEKMISPWFVPKQGSVCPRVRWRAAAPVPRCPYNTRLKGGTSRLLGILKQSNQGQSSHKTMDRCAFNHTCSLVPKIPLQTCRKLAVYHRNKLTFFKFYNSLVHFRSSIFRSIKISVVFILNLT